MLLKVNPATKQIESIHATLVLGYRDFKFDIYDPAFP